MGVGFPNDRVVSENLEKIESLKILQKLVK
jgi:hypothetical protein